MLRIFLQFCKLSAFSAKQNNRLFAKFYFGWSRSRLTLALKPLVNPRILRNKLRKICGAEFREKDKKVSSWNLLGKWWWIHSHSGDKIQEICQKNFNSSRKSGARFSKHHQNVMNEAKKKLSKKCCWYNGPWLSKTFCELKWLWFSLYCSESTRPSIWITQSNGILSVDEGLYFQITRVLFKAQRIVNFKTLNLLTGE